MSDFVHDSIFKDAFLRASHHYIDALELPDIHTRRSSDAQELADSAACINNRMLQSFAADLTEQQRSDVLNSTLLAQLGQTKLILKMQLAVMTLKAGTVNFQKYCLI